MEEMLPASLLPSLLHDALKTASTSFEQVALLSVCAERIQAQAYRCTLLPVAAGQEQPNIDARYSPPLATSLALETACDDPIRPCHL